MRSSHAICVVAFCLGLEVAHAATSADVRAITRHTEALMARLNRADCGEEYRAAWGKSTGMCTMSRDRVLFRRYAKATKDDAFVFFHLEACCGGSNSSTRLAYFSDDGAGYRLKAHTEVGGKSEPVDTSFIKISGRDFYARLEWVADALTGGVQLESYFRKYTYRNSGLFTDGRLYRSNGKQFKALTDR